MIWRGALEALGSATVEGGIKVALADACEAVDFDSPIWAPELVEELEGRSILTPCGEDTETPLGLDIEKLPILKIACCIIAWKGKAFLELEALKAAAAAAFFVSTVMMELGIAIPVKGALPEIISATKDVGFCMPTIQSKLANGIKEPTGPPIYRVGAAPVGAEITYKINL
jgi:hypothetical protein